MQVIKSADVGRNEPWGGVVDVDSLRRKLMKAKNKRKKRSK